MELINNMLTSLLHTFRVVHSVIREHSKLITRSSKWGSVRKAALLANPACSCCGSTERLQVHHCVPYHLRPELELEPKNLIVLCMSKNECHLLVGHSRKGFKWYNPYVMADLMNIQAGSVTLQEAHILAEKQALPN